MKPPPKLTVIINSYNYAEYLRQAIESVTTQDYADKELIIIDDGSTDASPDIVREYETRAKIILQANQGQTTACLSAVRHATGDYIQFLDSDDFLAPGALSAIAEHCEPDVAKIQFQLTPVGPEGQIVGKVFPPDADYATTDPRQLINESGVYPSPPNSGNVYRRNVFSYIDKIDYDPSIDGIPLLLAPFLGRVVQINKPLGSYRVHTRNWSGFSSGLTDFSKLSSARLRFEARRDAARLEHLASIVARNNLSGLNLRDPHTLPIVLERLVLAEVADGKAPAASLVRAYSRSIFDAPRSLGQRMAFVLWAWLLKLSPASLRKQLALARMNPYARFHALRKLRVVR